MITDHHAHSTRCFWDHEQAAWVCHPPAASLDIGDMLVVHTALLRECRLAPAAVRSGRHVGVVAGHLRLILELLTHHHEGEDRLLWPLVDERVPELRPVLRTLREQHSRIEDLVKQVRTGVDAWAAGGGAAAGASLADCLAELHVALVEHLDMEEREALPAAAVAMTSEEWHRIGEDAVAATAKPTLPLLFGMFAYEGDPAVLKEMLRAAPALPRLVLPVIAPRVYARRARRVHGTATP